jgi:hypothetical protein
MDAFSVVRANGESLIVAAISACGCLSLEVPGAKIAVSCFAGSIAAISMHVSGSPWHEQ